jgi:hypothetical protein
VVMLLPSTVVPFFPVNPSNNPKPKRVAPWEQCSSKFLKVFQIVPDCDEMNKSNCCP